MNTKDRIYIAGHRGLVGSAIIRQLEQRGFSNLITRTHKELDLINQQDVQTFFAEQKPDYVILAAAKVGGIHANNTYPAEFIYQNLMIEANIIHAAYQNGVKRLLFLGSTCIYPKAVQQPMREDALLTNILEPTNEPYAIAKIAGIKLCESYNRQYGTDYRSVMPTNLYGINDNYNLENSHVVSALMRKFHLGKLAMQQNWQAIKKDEKVYGPIPLNIKQDLNISIVKSSSLIPNTSVRIWGSGNSMREFLNVDDMATASLFVLELDKEVYQANTEPMLSHINVGTGKEIAIHALAETIAEVVGYQGGIVFDTSKPEGPSRKLIDTTRLTTMGWQYKTELKQGLERAYRWYQKQG